MKLSKKYIKIYLINTLRIIVIFSAIIFAVTNIASADFNNFSKDQLSTGEEKTIKIRQESNVSTNPNEMAEYFFKNIDIDKPELSKLKQQVLKHEYKSALESFRDYFINKIRKIDMISFYEANAQDTYTSDILIDNASVWAGKISVKAFFEKYPDKLLLPEYYLNISGNLTEPSNINWLATRPDGTVPDMTFRRFTLLCSAFNMTNDYNYFTKWQQIINDYALNYKTQVILANLPESDERTLSSNPINIQILARRTELILKQLAAFSKSLPADTQTKVNWTNVLHSQEGNVTREALDKIDPVMLANLLTFILKDHLYILDAQYTAPPFNNNSLEGLTILAETAIILDDFIPVKEELSKKLEVAINYCLETQIENSQLDSESEIIRLNMLYNYYNNMQNAPKYINKLRELNPKINEKNTQ